MACRQFTGRSDTHPYSSKSFTYRVGVRSFIELSEHERYIKIRLA